MTNYNAWATDDNDQTSSVIGDKTVRVKKPVPPNSAKKIRDLILLGEFGYTTLDIEEFNKKYPDSFIIENLVNAKAANLIKAQWASDRQVNNWRVEPEDGLTKINLPAAWVQGIIDFRKWRITAVINQAVLGIEDPELRKKVFDDLQKIFSLTESERLASLSNLLNATTGSLNSSVQVSTAISYLTDRAGYQDNPLLILVKANAAYNDAVKRQGPGYDLNALTLLAEAVRKAGNNFNFTADNSVQAITRQEAAYINRHASYLYARLGSEQNARERDWLARFYAIGEEERSALTGGEMIEIISTVTAVGTPQPITVTRKELEDVETERKKEIEMQSKTDKIGSQEPQTDHRTSEYFQKPTDGFTTEASVEKKIRAGQKGYKGQFKIVTYSEMPYQKANVYADGYGAGLDLFNKAVRYGVTLRRLNELTDYLNKRDQLIRKIRNENRYVVPPKPEEVEKVIKQVQRFGRITVNPFDKNRVLVSLADLDRLWEESNAFWKDRK